MKLVYAILIVMLLAVAGIFAYRYQDDGKRPAGESSVIPSEVVASSETASEPSASAPSQGLRIGSNALYVPEQLPGTTISVGFAALAVPGFVVIHEGADERVGAIVGASSFLPADETQSGVSITLSRPIREAEEFFAMLHQDDGDGVFDASRDVPVKDEQGNVIEMRFGVSADAEAGGEVSL